MVESDIGASDSCFQRGPIEPRSGRASGSAPVAYLGESLSVNHVYTSTLSRYVRASVEQPML